MSLLWYLIFPVKLIEFRTSLETHVQVSARVGSSARGGNISLECVWDHPMG